MDMYCLFFVSYEIGDVEDDGRIGWRERFETFEFEDEDNLNNFLYLLRELSNKDGGGGRIGRREPFETFEFEDGGN